jgi:hypothetical protein
MLRLIGRGIAGAFGLMVRPLAGLAAIIKAEWIASEAKVSAAAAAKAAAREGKAQAAAAANPGYVEPQRAVVSTDLRDNEDWFIHYHPKGAEDTKVLLQVEGTMGEVDKLCQLLYDLGVNVMGMEPVHHAPEAPTAPPVSFAAIMGARA